VAELPLVRTVPWTCPRCELADGDHFDLWALCTRDDCPLDPPGGWPSERKEDHRG